jgi:hypothetical protein
MFYMGYYFAFAFVTQIRDLPFNLLRHTTFKSKQNYSEQGLQTQSKVGRDCSTTVINPAQQGRPA